MHFSHLIHVHVDRSFVHWMRSTDLPMVVWQVCCRILWLFIPPWWHADNIDFSACFSLWSAAPLRPSSRFRFHCATNTLSARYLGDHRAFIEQCCFYYIWQLTVCLSSILYYIYIYIHLFLFFKNNWLFCLFVLIFCFFKQLITMCLNIWLVSFIEIRLKLHYLFAQRKLIIIFCLIKYLLLN